MSADPKPFSFLSFRDWLDRQLDRDDPIGDLARDVAADPYLAGTRMRSADFIGVYVVVHSSISSLASTALVAARDEWMAYARSDAARSAGLL